MKHIGTLLFIITISTYINAQAVEGWQWLKGGGSQFRPINFGTSSAHDYLSNMIVDDSGNVYISGTINNESLWDEDLYAFPNYSPQFTKKIAFLSKFSSCGSNIWTKYAFTPTSQIVSLTFGLLPNRDILWIYQGNSGDTYPISFGSSPTNIDTSFIDTIKSFTRDGHTFATIRSSDGKILNLKRVGDDNDSLGLSPLGLAIDNIRDNIWVLGGAGSDNVYFNNVNYKSKYYLMRATSHFNPNNAFPINVIPEFPVGTDLQYHRQSVARDGHFYSCGVWADSTNFVSSYSTVYKYYQNPAIPGFVSGFYVHYDSTGKLINHRVGKGPASQFQSIDVDDEGNVYLLTHGPDSIPYFDNIQAVTVSRDTFVDHLMVVKLDKRDSVIGYNVIRIASGEPNSGFRPAINQTYYGKLKVNPKTQEVYVACRIGRSLSKIDSSYVWETITNPLVPSTESVVIKLDKNLKYAWNTKTITNNNTQGTSGSVRTTYPEQVGIDGKGNVILGGTFNYGILIDTPSLSLQRPQNANQWIFFAKYGYPCNSNFSLIKPYEPEQLAAQAQSTSTINLNWTNGSTNEWGFYIYRSLNANGPYTLIDSTAQGVTQYLNTGLQSGTKYYYQVTAFNNAGESDSTNIASATTLTTVGVDEVAKNNVWVYPNPAYSYTQVELDEQTTQAQWYLYDGSGRQVREQFLSSRVNTVSLAGLAAGVYIYNVIDTKGEKIGRGLLAIQPK